MGIRETQQVTGSLRFDAPVRKWEYREPNPLYDGYTTRNWCRYHIMKHRDRERTREYTFRSDSFTLYSRSELDELAAILKGRLYKGILPDSLVTLGIPTWILRKYHVSSGTVWDSTDKSA